MHPFTGWLANGGRRVEAGLTAGPLCLCLLSECYVTQDTIQGYAFSLDLVLHKISMTKTQMTPSIHPAVSSEIDSHICTCRHLLLSFLKASQMLICPNVDSRTAPSPIPAINPAPPFQCSLPQKMEPDLLSSSNQKPRHPCHQFHHPAPSMQHPVSTLVGPFLFPPTVT